MAIVICMDSSFVLRDGDLWVLEQKADTRLQARVACPWLSTVL
jgi:hypothetical protein